jgi:hypothetical protein
MERNWKRLLKKHKPLQLIAAGDALTAKLIQQAGFPAYQVGGFALDGMRFGFPDMDVNRLGEKSAAVREIMQACDLPVLVDCDDGYGDEKNVVHTIHIYDRLGAPQQFSWKIRSRTSVAATWEARRLLNHKKWYIRFVRLVRPAKTLNRFSLLPAQTSQDQSGLSTTPGLESPWSC